MLKQLWSESKQTIEDFCDILTKINDDVFQNVILAILMSWVEGQRVELVLSSVCEVP